MSRCVALRRVALRYESGQSTRSKGRLDRSQPLIIAAPPPAPRPPPSPPFPPAAQALAPFAAPEQGCSLLMLIPRLG